MNAPFNYLAGDKIFARVIAYNEFGWGQPSPVNKEDFIMLTTRPGKMFKPQLFMKYNEKDDGIDIKMTWDEQISKELTGGQKILTYDVAWDDASLTQIKNLDGSIPA